MTAEPLWDAVPSARDSYSNPSTSVTVPPSAWPLPVITPHRAVASSAPTRTAGQQIRNGLDYPLRTRRVLLQRQHQTGRKPALLYRFGQTCIRRRWHYAGRIRSARHNRSIFLPDRSNQQGTNSAIQLPVYRPQPCEIDEYDNEEDLLKYLRHQSIVEQFVRFADSKGVNGATCLSTSPTNYWKEVFTATLSITYWEGSNTSATSTRAMLPSRKHWIFWNVARHSPKLRKQHQS